MRPLADLDREQELADRLSRDIMEALMAAGGNDPGFVGAVLTLTLGRLLADLDDEMAAKCVAMHTEKAMAFREILLRRPHAKN